MSRRVLIADDSLLVRLQIQRYLEAISPTGFVCCFAGDGVQALELIDGGGINLLIVDLNMPVMDGFELLRAIQHHRARPQATIVMTAAVGTLLTKELANYAVDAVIEKPVTVHVLANTLTQLDRPDTEPKHEDYVV